MVKKKQTKKTQKKGNNKKGIYKSESLKKHNRVGKVRQEEKTIIEPTAMVCEVRPKKTLNLWSYYKGLKPGKIKLKRDENNLLWYFDYEGDFDTLLSSKDLRVIAKYLDRFNKSIEDNKEDFDKEAIILPKRKNNGFWFHDLESDIKIPFYVKYVYKINEFVIIIDKESIFNPEEIYLSSTELKEIADILDEYNLLQFR